MKRIAITLSLVLSLITCLAQSKRTYDVAAYLYPAYAADDPRLRPFWPTGMGEWETVMTMQNATRATTGSGGHCGDTSTRPIPL